MKIGKVKISEELFKKGNIELLKLIFQEFTPVHIDRNAEYGILIYTGYSNQFEEIKEGEVIPYYEALLKPIDGKINFAKSK